MLLKVEVVQDCRKQHLEDYCLLAFVVGNYWKRWKLGLVCCIADLMELVHNWAFVLAAVLVCKNWVFVAFAVVVAVAVVIAAVVVVTVAVAVVVVVAAAAVIIAVAVVAVAVVVEVVVAVAAVVVAFARVVFHNTPGSVVTVFEAVQWAYC